jgi:glucokinase
MVNSKDGAYVVGIDLGGSSAKAVITSPSGDSRQKLNVPFDPAKRMDWAEKILEMVANIEAERGHPAESIGLSAPGLANKEGGAIAYMPGRLEGLEGLVWGDYLKRPKPLPVLNDAHAALLGEFWKGSAQGLTNVIMLTLGTGVGGAAIVDGRLLKGQVGRAGHLGHACVDCNGPLDVAGMPGSLELAIGNCTIAERGQGKFATTHDLVRAYQAGDEFAKKVWEKSVYGLACGISSFINIFDPQAVIVGGGVARAGDALFGLLEKFLRPIEWRPGGYSVPVLRAKLGEYAGAFGAAYCSMG